jgi:uncharacterized hydrophobic protein (TIGR00271 family)
MVHLRIVVPSDLADKVFALLCDTPAVINVVRFHDVAHNPNGDLIQCDVARENASLVIADLKDLQVPRVGSIAIELIDSSISDRAREAERAASGLPSDAVVWEEVEARTSEQTELSVSFTMFMIIAMQIGAVGIVLDQPILIVGAMVVGPEFGPLAALCVAVVRREPHLARRSLIALAVGFPVGTVAALFSSAILISVGAFPQDYGTHEFTDFISNPDFLSFFVAVVAGVAGMLSLTTAKSGALIGVLVSVTTIPAASNVGVAAAYGEWDTAVGAAEQLVINLAGIIVAGVLTLTLQNRDYATRRRYHLRERDSNGSA